MDIEALYELYLKCPSVQTDTRKLNKGDIFFALKGPNFDGNLFVVKALDAGASFAVTDGSAAHSDDTRIITVKDSLKTLQALASLHRSHFNIPFLAITGSNGKTTTKELIHAVLSSRYHTYTTEGNLNNHIGIPLTILKVKKDAEIAVVEMGANHQHEIESYCTYTRPGYGLITNIGKAHLEGFGGQEGVKKGKGELFVYLKTHGGTAFVNAMDDRVMDVSKSLDKKIFYGGAASDVTGKVLRADPFLEVLVTGKRELNIATRLVGNYNYPNVLAAVAVGRHFDIADEVIKKAIEAYTPSNSRSQMIKRGTNTIIMDAYNANPSSMRAAIENFAAMKGTNKILLLGAMKELGEESAAEHENLVRLIEKYTWKEVALTGKEFASTGHPYHWFENSTQAGQWFHDSHFKNAFILVKGSRSVQMEKVLE